MPKYKILQRPRRNQYPPESIFGVLNQTQQGTGAAPITYMYHDVFTTNAAAPLTSPRTAEPGPGTATLTDTANKMSISGNKLVLTTFTTSTVDPKYVAASGVAYAAGDCWRVLWRQSASGVFRLSHGSNIASKVSGTTLSQFPGGGNYGISKTITAGGVDYRFYILRCDENFLIFHDGTNYNLLQAEPKEAIGNLTLVSDNTNINLSVSDFSCGRLGATIGADYYLATDYKATPQANDTISTDADGLIRVKWRPTAAQVLDIQFRRTDDDNCWIVRCDQANSKIYLYEKQSGTETERGATGGVAITWATNVDHYIGIWAVGQTISVGWGNSSTATEWQKVTYATASYNATATGAKSTLAVTKFASYPRIIPAAKLSNSFFA